MTEKRIPVELGARSYEIVIQEGLIQNGGAEIIASLTTSKKIAFVSHPHLNKPYVEPLANGLKVQGFETNFIPVAAGERSKNLAAVGRLYGAFLDAKLDRKSLIVAVGGGVIGDLVGFAAATYLRGIPFIQVPTTLLAQVDASVGGKTGVDLPQGKNLVGAFHQPSAVLIDPVTLKTLPSREFRAGLAEVIKYGIIYDADFFSFLDCNVFAIGSRETDAVTYAIARSCEIKADVVAQDETEQGLRAILNFGHTVAHAIEAITNYRVYKHGEAVALGMVTESLIGEELGITPPAVTQRLAELLQKAGLPVGFPADISADAVMLAGQRDKKTIGGKLVFVLPEKIGTVAIKSVDNEQAIRNAIERQRTEF